jgi:hypothetical protein
MVSTSERRIGFPFTVATVFESCARWQPAHTISATANTASFLLDLEI